ncbi:metallophosphoesterase [Neobacillus mesonae]|uniref:metallophosphoesterase n=1 Tax=Neobacillus mesonae TaxID=1193713 RepID=UPI002041D5AC|nr:metallophosphoesterase [Neobacillus mesonae]MCM3570172.1 metallophosphoesterase [Neobacillus mesonae]
MKKFRQYFGNLAIVTILSGSVNFPFTSLAAETNGELERITEKADPAKPVVDELTLAVIGDYGGCGVGNCEGEQQVADMVHSWNPDYILTVGDNTYQRGLPEEVEKAQAAYIEDIKAGKFFPIMGNHDYGNGCTSESVQPSIEKFGVPVSYVAGFGNGLVDFVNPDANCNKSTGDQMPPIYDAYKNTIDNSQAEWVIAGEHQPVYSSGKAGNNFDRSWVMTPGVDLILAGHDHHAEHIETKDGYNIVISGNGGNGNTPIFSPVEGSLYRDDKNLGAVRLTVRKDELKVEYLTLSGENQYNFTLKKDETGKAYIADRMEWVDPNPNSGGSPVPNQYSVSMDFDDSTVLDGLSYQNYQDGPVSEVMIDGRKALQLEKNPMGGGNHAYLYVDDESILGGPYHAKVTIEYRSPKAGSFRLQYESADSGSAYQNSQSISIPNDEINQWKTATLEIPDIKFTNRQNNGADMRLLAANNLPILIGFMKVEIIPDEPAKFVSMDLDSEPNGLTWIPYESGPAHEMVIDGRTVLQVDKNPFNQGNNLYLSVDDRYIYGGPYNSRATIEYRSPVAGSFTLQYESAETGAAYQSAQKVTITEEDINKWQTATIDMPQAKFTNRQNGHADFRIVGAKNLPFIIGSMKIEVVDENSETSTLAMEAVNKAEKLAGDGLDEQEKIDAVVEAVNDATALIEQLEDVEKKVELQGRLKIVSAEVDQAQEELNLKLAKEAVEQAEQLPSEESVEKAQQAIDQLMDGKDKNTLIERLFIVKTILQADKAINTLLEAGLESAADVDQAIITLEMASKLVAEVPNNQRGNLTENLQKAENKIVDKMKSILSQKNNGKPERLKETWLNLLITNTINQLDGKVKTDINKIHQSIMKIVKEHATGKEVREAIEKIISKQ